MRDFLQKNRKALSVGFSVACSVFLVAVVVSAATTIGLNITTDGNTTLGDAAASDTVTLNSRFASALVPNALGTRDIGSYALSWGDVYASGTVFSGNLNASNTLTVSGNSTLGNATTDTITANARFASTVSPSTNSERDLGAFGVAWRILYSSSSLNVGSGAASTTIAATGNIMLSGHVLPGTNKASDLGAFATAWRNAYSSGTIFAGSVTSTAIGPWSNNTADLGAYSAAWKDVYVSGTLFADNISTSTLDNVVIGGSTRAAGSFTTVNANGNTTLGDAAASDTVTLNSRFVSDLVPTSTNSGNLGSDALSWRDVYASGTIYAGTALKPKSNASVNIGAYTTAFNNIYASSTIVAVGGTNATTTVNVGSQGGAGARGSCLIMTGENGTLYYITIAPNATSTGLRVSDVSCL